MAASARSQAGPVAGSRAARSARGPAPARVGTGGAALARLRAVAALLAVVMLAAACGQKPGVHQEGPTVGFAPGAEPGSGAHPTAEPSDDGEVFIEPEGDPAGGEPAGGAGGEDAAAPNGAEQAAEQGGQPAEGPAKQQQPQQQQPQQQQQRGDPRDRIGVTDTTIRIGIHAPLTGAAPLPQSEFQSGRDQYWRHIGQVAGRDVEVIVRDDQYNPSRATSVCDELIQRAQVFVLVGGGGVDQIAACARTAARQGVPYLSAGVDEGVLRQLPNYFAVSMSYVQQASLVAQYVDKHARPRDGRVAIVRDRTTGFNNVVARVQEDLTRRGFQTQVIQYQNGPSTAQAVSGYETAFAIMAPSDFVQIVGSPGGANPQWVGVGITMGLNTVASTACRASGNRYRGAFLSPFPGLNQIDRLDPEFRRAGGRGDIELALWGLNKSLHEVLKVLDGDLRRSRFVRALETSPIRTNVYPELRHSPDNHFGAQSAHLLVADCGRGEYVTPDHGLFVKGF